MKKITLLVASILLMGGGAANAAENSKFPQERRVAVDFRHADPIVFKEGGIEFFLYVDGQFDFNTRPSGHHKQFTPHRTSAVNRNHDGRGSYRNDYYGVKVEQDRMGRVRRVGNVSISYDRYNRVQRVGYVEMEYNRFALERVGGLEIVYNRRGQIVDMVGSVKDRRGYAHNQHNQHNDYDYGNHRNSHDNYDYRMNDRKVVKQDNRVATSVDVRIAKRN